MNLSSSFLTLCVLFGMANTCPAQALDTFESGAPLPSHTVRLTQSLSLRFTEIELGERGLKTSLKNLLSGLNGVRVEENDLEFRIIFESDILFDFDRANIRADAEKILSVVAGALEQFEGKSIRLIGFTDSKGADEYNMKLSLRRAESVKRFLQAQTKLTKFRFKVEGKGEMEPIAPNFHENGEDNPEGRQKNRRVEIRIPK